MAQRKMQRFIVAICLGLFLAPALPPVQVFAQDKVQTLADIRAELRQLAAEISGLRTEMLASGEASMQLGGGSALDRMNTLEAELVRLTARTEELGNRINRVADDGTKRVKNLEFRLCELEEGCDISDMPISKSLGGEATPVAGAPGTQEAPKLAGSEQGDFDRAKATFDSGDYQSAADQFGAFAQAYTGGPLSGEAQYLRGEALVQLGQHSEAAKAFLDTFSAAPDGPRAADSLLRLGQALGQLGQNQEACLTLAEVPSRYPQSPAAAQAGDAMRSLGCQ